MVSMASIQVHVILVLLFAHACVLPKSGNDTSPKPSDPNSTPQARALFQNLDRVRHTHTLFGHQETLAYGVHWVNEAGRSDVLDVAGSYPAVYGWDIGGIEKGLSHNLDGVSFEQMQHYIREAYIRGGVITISWHAHNPLTGGDAWDVAGDGADAWDASGDRGDAWDVAGDGLDAWDAPGDRGDAWDAPGEASVLASLLPDSTHNVQFTQWLDALADFFDGLTVSPTPGEHHHIPVIFRPFHEMNGDWFWWGTTNNTDEVYRALYRFMVDYLRIQKGLHHILYAYSPNSPSEFETMTDYWRWYPGDPWVDVLGFDDYYTSWGGYGHEDGVATLTNHLVWLVEQAELRGKIPAFTETGQGEVLTDADWYTAQLLPALAGHPAARRLAWVLVWRNANAASNRENHFYVPFEGHPAADNFRSFTQDSLILMENDLPDMYRRK
jgi:mannan endo-1,4-beta-mannosidase